VKIRASSSPPATERRSDRDRATATDQRDPRPWLWLPVRVPIWILALREAALSAATLSQSLSDEKLPLASRAFVNAAQASSGFRHRSARSG
jgi:hypothetical protein